LAIVTLALWALTAAIGMPLLAKVSEAAREAVGSPRKAEAPVPGAASPAPQGAGPPTPQATAPPTRPAAPGEPPPIPRVRVTAAPGEHPLLEFCHPLLALVGLACWFAFVFVHFRTFASIGLVALIVTIVVGVGLLVVNGRATRRRAAERGESGRGADRPVPMRLILLHGLAAVITLGLAAFITVRA
jgi:UPF0716 family protein affecting phage T7 exclusion